MKDIIIYNIYIAWVIALCSSCNSPLSQALDEAGNNRSELETVLEHYKNDELKLQAARFLIENMDAHYSSQSEAIDTFYNNIDSIFTKYKWESDGFYNYAYDSILIKMSSIKAVETKRVDIENIKSDYLIAHIDSAFKVWNQIWAGEYSFEHFCNYVLPYRVGQEPVSDWRKAYMEQYLPRVQHLQNSQFNYHYKYGSYSAINQWFHTAVYYPKESMPEFPLNLLLKVRVGNCDSYASRNVAQMRAIGLPAAKDFTPQWGNRSMGHSWAVLLPEDDLAFPFGQNERLGDHFFARPEHKLPKVFRQTFKKQPEMYDIAYSDEKRPELFQSPCLMDVTSSYIKTSDVDVSLFSNPVVDNREWIYLAVFNNQNWSIVHYSRRKGEKAHFMQMGRGIVYLPVCYASNEQIVPAGYPFILNTDGTTHILRADTTQLKRIRLTRKYTFSDWLKTLCKRTWGGKFQVADKEDFSDSLTIATIDSITESRFHSLSTNYTGKYRYFRYLSPNGSHGNMAEVEMYDSVGVRAPVKNMFGARYATRDGNLERMFDGDVLTCYNRDAADDGWAAVEFEQPVHLSNIRFLPRNDDNFIREGENYQLFYWDGNEWSLIKEMEGNRDGVLHFDNVPDNALLLLHNTTKGKEERIFTYENKKQVWW